MPNGMRYVAIATRYIANAIRYTPLSYDMSFGHGGGDWENNPSTAIAVPLPLHKEG
jgi:hypothetical protein